MLDLARVTFLQSVEDINRTADSMTQEYGYTVKVQRQYDPYAHPVCNVMYW